MEDYRCRQREQELTDYQKRLSFALRAAKVCIFEIDMARRLCTYFENAEAVFGIPEDKILQDVQDFSGLPVIEYFVKLAEYFMNPEDVKQSAAAFHAACTGTAVSFEARMHTGEERYAWKKIDLIPMPEDVSPERITGIISDIQNIKERMVSLEHEVQLDAFTRLYSKKSFENMCRSLFEQEEKERSALIIMDLDNFKGINDQFGHKAGDEVILSVAGRLKEVFRRQDIAARFGGDEFVVLMRNISSREAAEDKVRRLLSETDNPLDVKKSIGVAIYPDMAADYDTLFIKADRALYEAKRDGNTYAFGQ